MIGSQTVPRCRSLDLLFVLIGEWWFVQLRRNWSNISSMQNRFLEILVHSFVFAALSLHE